MSKNLQEGFYGARLKIERANRHIDELEYLICEIPKLYRQKGLSITDQGNGSMMISIEDLAPIGDKIRMTLGDAIHNLRSALDHVWSALYREAGITGSKSLATFPFHETRINLINAIDESPIKKSFPEVEGLILDKLKPHRDEGGNSLLWTITKLDKLDKHNMVIPAITSTQATDVKINLAGDNKFIFANASENLLQTNIPFEHKHHGELIFEVTFPEGGFLGGEAVLPSVVNMSEAVSESVELFSATFMG